MRCGLIPANEALSHQVVEVVVRGADGEDRLPSRRPRVGMMWLVGTRVNSPKNDDPSLAQTANLVASDHVDEQRYAINSLPSLWA